ncbi:unnamed protein product [Meganyctiphanes norvegica]|uniref:Thioredoxin domain-containing protein n=1 Tax=Meganyctiphanes norvegica TaxID=48144 RepID=A0AAV2RSS8_MEGNR
MCQMFMKGVLAISITILIKNIVSANDALLNDNELYNDSPPHDLYSSQNLKNPEEEQFDNDNTLSSSKLEINEFNQLIDEKEVENVNNNGYIEDISQHDTEERESHIEIAKEVYEENQDVDRETETQLEDKATDQSDTDLDTEDDRSNIFDIEPELQNVPLREILLKLKPEGLTDEDEEEPISDIPVLDMPTTEDVEPEEESLSSSGLPEGDSSNSSTSNGTESNEAANVKNYNSKKAACLELNVTEPIGDVEIINASHLLKLLQGDVDINTRSTAARCHLVYFFSPYCPFSVMGSPYVNALARSLPNVPIFGLDSIEHHSVNARYGVMGTPTFLLFHNGNGAGRYNSSEFSVSSLMNFVHYYTDQDIPSINVTSDDFRATLPSEIKSTRGYALIAAWTFMLTCGTWMFVTSHLCARLTEAILNNWREAEAQHDHQD